MTDGNPLPRRSTSVNGIVVGFLIGTGQLLAIEPGIAAAFPVVVPSAPGNVAKKLSKLRFSWMTMMTCFIFVDGALAARPSEGSTGIVPREPAPHARTAALIARKAIRMPARAQLHWRMSYSVSTGRPEGF